MSLSLILLSSSLVASTTVSQQVGTFQEFKIDLDLEPTERFKESATFFKDQITVVRDLYMDIFPELILDMFARMEPFIALH